MAKTEATQADEGLDAVLKRLEQIVEKLESQDISLEDSLSAFEEGVKLSRHSQDILDNAERRVEILLQDGRLASFNPQDTSYQKNSES